MAAATVTAALLLAGCADTPLDPSTSSSEGQPVAGNFEEAAMIALGEFRIHGPDAQPAPVEVTGEIDTHNGQRAWRIDATYEVTIDNQRQQQRWTLWIGPTDDSPLTLLDADGPE